VIKGFMIQGGCPLGQGNSGPGFKFKDEINAKSLGLDKEMAMIGEDLNPQCQ
jgi:cyclophilin family peptidyl-prolyl cis-trans isomerase